MLERPLPLSKEEEDKSKLERPESRPRSRAMSFKRERVCSPRREPGWASAVADEADEADEEVAFKILVPKARGVFEITGGVDEVDESEVGLLPLLPPRIEPPRPRFWLAERRRDLGSAPKAEESGEGIGPGEEAMGAPDND